MDPNLTKIYEANINDIKRGKLTIALNHAEDYLYRITTPYIAQKELNQFTKFLHQMSKPQKKES